MSEAFKEAQETRIEDLATKNDLKIEITKLENKIDTLELRLTIKLGALIAAGIVIVATLIKLL